MEGVTNGEMRPRFTSIPKQLVPCQRNRGAPAEQVFAAELAPQTDQAVTEGAAAREDNAEVRGNAAGACGSET